MRVMFVTAHPDDAEFSGGGTIKKFTSVGHDVKILILTNGNAGHQVLRGQQLIGRRDREVWASSHIGGFEYQILNHHDGTLYPTAESRDELIGLIRMWKPDIVFTHRPNDYHPDHRYAGVLVQDAVYLLTVPAIVPRVEAIRRMPMIVYFEDRFTKPLPFEPDIVVSIDDTIDDKIAMLHCHASQVYEWLPHSDGRIDEVPEDEEKRKEWLGAQIRRRAEQTAEAFRTQLKVLYGDNRGGAVKYAEAFEASEYGLGLTSGNRADFFPFFD